jgi:hypothetical protein
VGGQCDYVLKYDARDEGDPNIPRAVISGHRRTILSAYASDNYSIDAQLQTNDGRPLGTHHAEEKASKRMEILMLFGTPFANPWSVDHRSSSEIFSDVGAWNNATVAGPARTHRSFTSTSRSWVGDVTLGPGRRGFVIVVPADKNVAHVAHEGPRTQRRIVYDHVECSTVNVQPSYAAHLAPRARARGVPDRISGGAAHVRR